jgi:hypothetical protein
MHRDKFSSPPFFFTIIEYCLTHNIQNTGFGALTGGYEESYLLGHNVMWSVERRPPFHRNSHYIIFILFQRSTFGGTTSRYRTRQLPVSHHLLGRRISHKPASRALSYLIEANVPPKRRLAFNRLRGITSQKKRTLYTDGCTQICRSNTSTFVRTALQSYVLIQDYK